LGGLIAIIRELRIPLSVSSTAITVMRGFYIVSLWGKAVLKSHPLVQFKRGDHVCIFYRDERTLVETLADYLAAGVRNGERCFCAQKPHLISDLLNRLRLTGVPVEEATASGALEIHALEDVYFVGGHFDPNRMIAMLERSIDDALAKGFSGFRTAGELSWALEDGSAGKRYCDQLLEYEAMVQAAYPSKAAVGLCQYPAHRFPQELIDSVLAAHRMALEETMVSTNHSTLTLRSGSYFADIVADRMNPASAFHYVVQKRGELDVLSWGIEPTIDQAIRSSESVFSSMASDGRVS
jgi:hypothetical protein